ncbi:PilZ domain-containing protein [Kaarinaea lacus]
MKFWRSHQRTATVRERRLDQRKPSTIQAAMCWEHDHTRQCRITSLSLTGMFLESPDTDVNIGTILQLFFYCTMDDSKKLCNEWVRVVGKRDTGVAVSFAQFDNQHQSNIQLMLQQAVNHTHSIAGDNYQRKTSPGTATIQKSA